VKLASPSEFLVDLKQHRLPKERYIGELYFQAHRGTYTSQAKMKLANRRCEFALREAEFWGTIARTIKGHEYSNTTLRSSWLSVLLHQFHDILPGSSINKVYEEGERTLNSVIDKVTAVANNAAASLVGKSNSVTVFNSLSWERNVLMDLPSGPEFVTIPACGWKTVSAGKATRKNKKVNNKAVKATLNTLENEIFIAWINQRGEITSLIDKATGTDMMAGPGNRFCLYKDIPARFDAWDIDSMTENLLMETDEPVKVEVVRSDDYLASIRLSRKIHDSSINQLISIQKNSHRLDFETTVDWQESHKLLKVSFPVNIHSDEAIHEIQFGHIRRPTHRSRPFDADRFEVSNHKWTALTEEDRGVALLNDSKYGISVLRNDLKLTLLKSALAPDPTADKGVQKFTYSFYYWMGSFFTSNVIQESYELNCPLMQVPGNAGEESIFKLSAPNIILETVKLAEDGSGDIILRLYESKRSYTHCKITTILPVAKATQTDMLERFLDDIAIKRGVLKLVFRPFEIKTIRLTLS